MTFAKLGSPHWYLWSGGIKTATFRATNRLGEWISKERLIHWFLDRFFNNQSLSKSFIRGANLTTWASLWLVESFLIHFLLSHLFALIYFPTCKCKWLGVCIPELVTNLAFSAGACRAIHFLKHVPTLKQFLLSKTAKDSQLGGRRDRSQVLQKNNT